MPENIESNFVCAGKTLSSKSQIKDRTKEKHRHDLVYHAKCPESSKVCIDETGRRLQDRVGKDTKSNVLSYSYQVDHVNVRQNDFQILRNGYKKMKFKRKLSIAGITLRKCDNR